MTTAGLLELAAEYGDINAHGYRVEKYAPSQWQLLDAETGASLMIANYGCIAPTRAAAELEAYGRIAQDERARRAIAGEPERRGVCPTCGRSDLDS